MPKLIRLYKPDGQHAEFQNEFTESIILRPDSRIALKNLNFVLRAKDIDIPAGITLGTSLSLAGPARDVVLQQGSYNLTSFCKMVTNAMNSSLAYQFQLGANNSLTTYDNTVATDNGFQWLVNPSVDKPGHLNTQFSRSEVQAVPFVTGTGSAAQWLAYNISNVPLARGCLLFSVRIQSASGDIMGSDFVVGITSMNQQQASVSGISPQNIDFGITRATDNSDGYSVWAAGKVIHPKIKMSNGGDFTTAIYNRIMVYTAGGTLRLRLFRNQALGGACDSEEVDTGVPFDFTKTYYAAYSVQVGPIGFDQMVWTPSSLAAATEQGVTMARDFNTTENNHRLGALQATQVSLLFDTYSAGSYMGYDDDQTMTAVTGSFVSQDEIVDTQLNSSLTVEIPTLALESYDGQTGSKRSIVAVVDKLDQMNVGGTYSKYSYSAEYPIFLDLKNKNELVLNNLFCRVMVGSVPIELDGILEITLIVDG